jgi:hypothetical protein
MRSGPSAQELDDLFEETWQIAELAAISDDCLLAPWLIEHAYELLAWRNQLNSHAPDRLPAAPVSPMPPPLATAPAKAALDERARRLLDIDMLIVRQQAFVAKYERLGRRSSAEKSRELLMTMMEDAAVTKAAVAASTAAARKARESRDFVIAAAKALEATLRDATLHLEGHDDALLALSAMQRQR